MRSALLSLTFSLFLCAPICAQTRTTFEGMTAYQMANGKLSVTVLEQGGAIASVSIPNDPQHRNPLWEPMRMARETGEKPAFGPSMGHFLCVDGFGGVSEQEKAAGFPNHGEAYRQKFKVQADPGGFIEMSTPLPLAMEKVSRTLRLLPDRPVLQVETALDNDLSFDRPIQWAEHATVGSPFLEPGATVVDMSVVRAKTRPYENGSGGLPHRLVSGTEFTWPQAPAIGGGQANMRLTPEHPNSGDHTTSLMDPSREWEWVTVLNTKSHLLLGYLFRREDFPWIQTWEYYPPNGKLARGLELSTQPFDVPRRQVVTENSLFGAPTYRWLPAKSRISGVFYLFFIAVPEGWMKIEDVRLEGDRIRVQPAQGSAAIL